uniref:MATH domain-containing protein n=1 Tax=Brassica campestris TaxID=3711 RepID=M4CKG7_BRACM
MWSQNPSFRFEIEELWKKKKKADRIFSKIFVAGGCEWEGNLLMNHDHLSVYLHATKPKSLRIGWKRNVSFYFTVLNHRKIERCRSESCFSEEDIRSLAEHPDIALGFKPKSQVVKTAYMNVLLGLINTLNKPSESHLEAELVISHSELSELEEVGFKIDWLKSKLENNFLERKKDDADGSRVQQLEERVKNLEDVSLEKKKADEAYGFRVQQFEESVKKLEMMVSVLKAKLDQEKAKSDSDDFLLL